MTRMGRGRNEWHGSASCRHGDHRGGPTTQGPRQEPLDHVKPTKPLRIPIAVALRVRLRFLRSRREPTKRQRRAHGGHDLLAAGGRPAAGPPEKPRFEIPGPIFFPLLERCMSTSENFLPAFQLAETPAKRRNKVRCQIRNYDVPATPEERVRQRVLHWLINTKGWTTTLIQLERAYAWESDASRSYIKPDIELLDEDGGVVVVVECKHEDVPLSKAVDDQAGRLH